MAHHCMVYMYIYLYFFSSVEQFKISQCTHSHSRKIYGLRERIGIIHVYTVNKSYRLSVKSYFLL